MITFAIAALFTAILFTIGFSWIEVGIAIPLVIVMSRGTTRIESWVERRTGRIANPKSAAYTLAYFSTALGVMLPSIYYFPDLHPIVLGVIIMLSCTLATTLGVVIFGLRVPNADRN